MGLDVDAMPLQRLAHAAQAFHRGQGTTGAAAATRIYYFARSRILYARKHFGAPAAVAVTLSTLFLEPIARLIASPRSARATLRAFGMLWKDLPSIVHARNAGS